MEQEAMKDEAVRLVSILPSLYSDDLKREELWERIGNGIIVSVAKSGGKWDAFLNHILQYIKADPGRVATSKSLDAWCETIAVRPKEWQDGILRYLESRHFLVVIKARSIWNMNKEARKQADSEVEGDKMRGDE